MAIRQIHAPYRDARPDAQQMRPCREHAFRHRPEVIHFQLDGGESPLETAVVEQRAADGGIRYARGYAAVQGAGAVHELFTDLAPDSETIAVRAHQLEAQQVVELVAAKKCARLMEILFRIDQFRRFYQTCR